MYRLEMVGNGLSVDLLTSEKEIRDQYHLMNVLNGALKRALKREAESKEEQQELLDQWARSLTKAGMPIYEVTSLDEITENLKEYGVYSLLSAEAKFPMKLEPTEDSEEETWAALTSGLTQSESDWF